MTRKIALVGIGKIARDQHLPALAASPDFKLVATVSRNARVEGVPGYADIPALLAAQPEVEVISLATPPGPRFFQAEQALAAGKHVMLEKPPGASLSEVHTLRAMARAQGLTLYASWHSRQAAQVAAAKAWLAGKKIRRFVVTWKEDVRKWHPGQDWVFEPGGMGVFDPGINALSIVTEILPDPILLTAATLAFPANRATPIAVQMRFHHPHGGDVSASFDWDYAGEDLWDIEAETEAGTMLLRNGGARLLIDGVEQPGAQAGLAGEYPRLYAEMARLLGERASEVDLRPMVLLADAMTLGERRIVEDFEWQR